MAGLPLGGTLMRCWCFPLFFLAAEMLLSEHDDDDLSEMAFGTKRIRRIIRSAIQTGYLALSSFQQRLAGLQRGSCLSDKARHAYCDSEGDDGHCDGA